MLLRRLPPRVGVGVHPVHGVCAAADLTITGQTHRFVSPSARGTDAVRNFCAACGSLVFGGIVGVDTSHTVYAGTLDDAAAFVPTIAVFVRDKPDWVLLPPGLTVFAAMPAWPRSGGRRRDRLASAAVPKNRFLQPPQSVSVLESPPGGARFIAARVLSHCWSP